MSTRDRIKPIAEMAAEYGPTILLYGDPGIGKTTAVGTIPGRTLVIDIDGGSQVLRCNDSVDILPIHEDMDGWKEMMLDLPEIVSDYSTIVLDNFSELEKYMLMRLADSGKNKGVPEMSHYQRVQFALRDTARRFRDLREVGKNVVINAWSMPLDLEQEEGIIKTIQAPMISKKISSELCGLFDIVGYMHMRRDKDGEQKRIIELSAAENFIAKNRFGSPSACSPDMGKLIEHIMKGGK